MTVKQAATGLTVCRPAPPPPTTAQGTIAVTLLSFDTDPQPVKPKRLILRAEARRRLGGISRATELRMLKTDPRMPQPVLIASKLTGYDEALFNAFVAELLNGDG
jgi:predicted DNA-binding transcriptional regulator AlpA